jgi:hypothetical protein
MKLQIQSAQVNSTLLTHSKNEMFIETCENYCESLNQGSLSIGSVKEQSTFASIIRLKDSLEERILEKCIYWGLDSRSEALWNYTISELYKNFELVMYTRNKLLI